MTKQNKHSLSVEELAIRVNQLEQENSKLRRASDMLGEISTLVKNAGGGTTLESVALIRNRTVMQRVRAFLAMSALEFEAGDWNAEDQVRHLREQIKQAASHLGELDTMKVPLDEFIVIAKVSDSPGAFVYSKLHYTFSDALADCLEHQSWVDCKIRYKGVDLAILGDQP